MKHFNEAIKNATGSLKGTLESLSPQETILLDLIVSQEDELNAGTLYDLYKEKEGVSYASFDRILKKLELLRILDTKFTGKGVRGNSRIIIPRFSREEIKKFLY
jgi:cell division control protein 6